MTRIERSIIEWLAGDDTGLSSRAIAFTALGIDFKGSRYWPHDPDDLGRCARLVQQIPEARRGIKLLAKKHREWQIVLSHWDELLSLMVQEVGIDWTKSHRAPKTYRRMKDLGL